MGSEMCIRDRSHRAKIEDVWVRTWDMGLGSSLSCSIVQTLYKKKIRQLRCILCDAVIGSTFCEIGVGLSENIKSDAKISARS